MTSRMYLLALAVTLALEAPIVALGYRGSISSTGVRRWGVAFLSVNLFTHGLLWMAQPRGLPRLAGAEGMIVLVEAALYARLFGGGGRRAFLVSLAANALSLGAGLLLWRVV
jgi:hypothetical protein